MNALAADRVMACGAGFTPRTHVRRDGSFSGSGKGSSEECADALDVPLHGADERLRNKAVKLAAVILLHGALAVWLMNAQVAPPELTIPIRLDVRTVEVPSPSPLEKTPAMISEAPKPLPAVRKPLPVAPKPVTQPKAASTQRQVLAALPKAEPSSSEFVAPPGPTADSSKAEDSPSAHAAAAEASGGKASSGSAVSSAARFDADYLKNPAPPYPPMSRKRQEEGKVILNVRVTADGRAEQVSVRQGSGYSRLDEAALSTVQHWRFVPARSGNEPVAASVLVPIEFRLDS